MKRKPELTLIKAACRTLCCAVLLLFGPAGAAVLNITTEFKADVRNPGNNEFRNSTPISGFCAFFPRACSEGEFSILIPGLTAEKTFEFASKDIRKHTWLAIDGRTREVSLTNAQTKQQITAQFRWAFFGVNHNAAGNQRDLGSAMHNTGGAPSGDCSARAGGLGTSRYRHGWGIFQKKAVCYRRLNNNLGDGRVRIDNFSLGYILKTDKPLDLPAGEYEGEVVYSIGEGLDIDFAADSYSDSEVRIKIKAIVEHAFYLKFPRDNMDVRLTPPGGWGSWINGGVTPEKLSSEVPFALTSSGSFKVAMQCEHTEGRSCGLQNKTSGEMVPLDVKMTIPGFVSAGQPVRGLALNASEARVIDTPGSFVVDLNSKLNFEVSRPGVEKMVKEPGSKWQGVVTLVFDSDIR